MEEILIEQLDPNFKFQVAGRLGGESIKACLTVTNRTNSRTKLVNESCITSSAGTILIGEKTINIMEH